LQNPFKHSVTTTSFEQQLMTTTDRVQTPDQELRQWFRMRDRFEVETNKKPGCSRCDSLIVWHEAKQLSKLPAKVEVVHCLCRHVFCSQQSIDKRQSLCMLSMFDACFGASQVLLEDKQKGLKTSLLAGLRDKPGFSVG
jgi:hypothetical protein